MGADANPGAICESDDERLVTRLVKVVEVEVVVEVSEVEEVEVKVARRAAEVEVVVSEVEATVSG